MKKSLLCIVALVFSLCYFSGCKPEQCETYTIEEAYEAGLITRDDIMEICFQRYGVVHTCDDPDTPQDEWTELDYNSTQKDQYIGITSEERILYTYYKKYEPKFFFYGERLGGVENLSFKFFGLYGGLFAGAVKNPLWYSTTETYNVFVDGIIWADAYSDNFLLYKL